MPADAAERRPHRSHAQRRHPRHRLPPLHGPRLGRGYIRAVAVRRSLRGAYGLGRVGQVQGHADAAARGHVPAGAGHRRGHRRHRGRRAAAGLHALRRSTCSSSSRSTSPPRHPQLSRATCASGSMSLYFSRPLERVDYVLAKYAALTSALFVLTALPLIDAVSSARCWPSCRSATRPPTSCGLAGRRRPAVAAARRHRAGHRGAHPAPRLRRRRDHRRAAGQLRRGAGIVAGHRSSEGAHDARRLRRPASRRSRWSTACRLPARRAEPVADAGPPGAVGGAGLRAGRARARRRLLRRSCSLRYRKVSVS